MIVLMNQIRLIFRKLKRVIKIIGDSRKCGYTIRNCYQKGKKILTISIQVRNIFL